MPRRGRLIQDPPRSGVGDEHEAGPLQHPKDVIDGGARHWSAAPAEGSAELLGRAMAAQGVELAQESEAGARDTKPRLAQSPRGVDHARCARSIQRCLSSP